MIPEIFVVPSVMSTSRSFEPSHTEAKLDSRSRGIVKPAPVGIGTACIAVITPRTVSFTLACDPGGSGSKMMRSGSSLLLPQRTIMPIKPMSDLSGSATCMIALRGGPPAGFGVWTNRQSDAEGGKDMLEKPVGAVSAATVVAADTLRPVVVTTMTAVISSQIKADNPLVKGLLSSALRERRSLRNVQA